MNRRGFFKALASVVATAAAAPLASVAGGWSDFKASHGFLPLRYKGASLVMDAHCDASRIYYVGQQSIYVLHTAGEERAKALWEVR